MQYKLFSTLALALALIFTGLTGAQADYDPTYPTYEPDPLGYATYQGQVSCSKTPMRGTVEFSRIIMRKFGGSSSGILRGCRVGGQSEHKEGRAFDWRLNAHKASDRRKANRAIKWLTETKRGVEGYNAKQFGVMYVIWNGKMWRAYDAEAGWKKYTGDSPHKDHMHFSLSWAAAGKNSSYWRGDRAIFDYGPCVKVEGKLARPWSKPRLKPCPEPEPKPDRR